MPLDESQSGKSEEQIEAEREQKREVYEAGMREHQNLLMGTIAGVIAMLVAAGLWGIISYVTNWQIGWMAIILGLMVGYGVRFFGKGVDFSFGLVGGFLSLVGVVLGNSIFIATLYAQDQGLTVFDTLWPLIEDGSMMEELIENYDIIDLLFYGLALIAGFASAMNLASDEELDAMELPPES